MPEDPHPRDSAAVPSYLDEYRAEVERLRCEAAEPMAPAAASMLAVLAASLPLVALLHPGLPVDLQGWQQALALFVVWLVAFRIQTVRCSRFDARWSVKIAALQAAEARRAVPARSRLRLR